MSDYDKYLSALATDASDNLYSDFGGIADKLSLGAIDYVKQPGADIGESLLYGSILGLLGGSLGQMGMNQAAEETGLASKVLTGAMSQRPEGLPENLYRKALTYKDVIAASRAQDAAVKRADAELGLEFAGKKSAQDKSIEIGTIDDTLIAEERAQQLLSGAMDMKDSGGEVSRPGAFTQAGKYVKDIEDQATTAIQSLPSVAKLQTTRAALGQISKMADLNTKTSDIPFITVFIGGLDGSVVKEGEYDRVGGANPLLRKWANTIESTLNAKSELGVEIKQQMLNELYMMENGLAEQAQADSGRILGIAEKRGGSRDFIGSVDFTPTKPISIVAPVDMKQQARDFAAAGRAKGLSDEEIISGWSSYKSSLGQK